MPPSALGSRAQGGALAEREAHSHLLGRPLGEQGSPAGGPGPSVPAQWGLPPISGLVCRVPATFPQRHAWQWGGLLLRGRQTAKVPSMRMGALRAQLPPTAPLMVPLTPRWPPQRPPSASVKTSAQRWPGLAKAQAVQGPFQVNSNCPWTRVSLSHGPGLL